MAIQTIPVSFKINLKITQQKKTAMKTRSLQIVSVILFIMLVVTTSVQADVSGNYKCRFSANKNASKSASLISDLQRNKIIKNDNFNDCFLLKTSFPESQKTLPFSFSRSSINCLIRKINGQPSTCQGHVNARLCAMPPDGHP